MPKFDLTQVVNFWRNLLFQSGVCLPFNKGNELNLKRKQSQTVKSSKKFFFLKKISRLKSESRASSLALNNAIKPIINPISLYQNWFFIQKFICEVIENMVSKLPYYDINCSGSFSQEFELIQVQKN